MSKAMEGAKRPPKRPGSYPEGTTPEQVAAKLGFVPPHQRPEVQERMREREALQRE